MNSREFLLKKMGYIRKLIKDKAFAKATQEILEFANEVKNPEEQRKFYLYAVIINEFEYRSNKESSSFYMTSSDKVIYDGSDFSYNSEEKIEAEQKSQKFIGSVEWFVTMIRNTEEITKENDNTSSPIRERISKMKDYHYSKWYGEGIISDIDEFKSYLLNLIYLPSLINDFNCVSNYVEYLKLRIAFLSEYPNNRMCIEETIKYAHNIGNLRNGSFLGYDNSYIIGKLLVDMAAYIHSPSSVSNDSE